MSCSSMANGWSHSWIYKEVSSHELITGKLSLQTETCRYLISLS